MRYSTDKEMNETLQQLVSEGFTIEYGRHTKVRSPEGQLFTCSMSPSCPNAHKQLLRDIKRYRWPTSEPGEASQQGDTVEILVAGINKAENQFTRRLAKYGCKVTHIDADPSYIPPGADAAVIVLSALDKIKQVKVKEVYSGQGKPVFVAHRGWSEIGEGFEKWWNDTHARRAGLIEKKPATRKNFTNNNYEPEGFELEPVKEEPVETETQRFDRIVTECANAGMSVDETVEMLGAEQISSSSEQVVNARIRMKLMVGKGPEPIKAPEPVKTTDDGFYKLFDEIMSSPISSEDKLQFLDQARRGALTDLVVTEIRVQDDLMSLERFHKLHKFPTIRVEFTTEEARLTLEHVDAMRHFVDKE